MRIGASLAAVRSTKFSRRNLAPLNFVRNPTAAGAVSGSPGTLPTNWSMTNFGGLTRTVTAGDGYLDLRVVGTSSNTVNRLFFEGTGVVSAATGQIWYGGLDIAIIAGSTANIGTLCLMFLTTDGTTTKAEQGPAIGASLTSTLQRFTTTSALSQAAVTSVGFALLFNIPGTPAIDITVRVRNPSYSM